MARACSSRADCSTGTSFLAGAAAASGSINCGLVRCRAMRLAAACRSDEKRYAGRFSTRPYLTVAMLLLGIAAAFRSLYRAAKEGQRVEDGQDEKEDE